LSVLFLALVDSSGHQEWLVIRPLKRREHTKTTTWKDAPSFVPCVLCWNPRFPFLALSCIGLWCCAPPKPIYQALGTRQYVSQGLCSLAWLRSERVPRRVGSGPRSGCVLRWNSQLQVAARCAVKRVAREQERTCPVAVM